MNKYIPVAIETENGFIDEGYGGMVPRPYIPIGIDGVGAVIGGTGPHPPSLADLRGQSLAKLLRDQGRALQMPRGGNHGYWPPGEKSW